MLYAGSGRLERGVHVLCVQRAAWVRPRQLRIQVQITRPQGWIMEIKLYNLVLLFHKLGKS
jgi:hypothetical protein